MGKLNKNVVQYVVNALTAVAILAPQGQKAWADAPAIYSNSEGYVSKRHTQDFALYRQKYFYTKGELDLKKLNELEIFLKKQKTTLLNSAKLNKKTNLIFKHGYEQKEAEKKGLDAQDSEAEALAPILFALEHIEDLKSKSNSMSKVELVEKVETILLFFSAAYTVYPVGIFTSGINRAKNLARNFFDFKINDIDQVQASNLLNPVTKNFLSADEIRNLQSNNQDISKIDPPSSAFWTNNQVESYDPMNESYWDEKLFPDRKIDIPIFYYKRMGNGNIKIKTEWIDYEDLNKEGKPKKKDVTIRLGHEAYATPIASHLARIVGYPANPNTFRKKIKLILGDVTFEQFVKSWLDAHGGEQGTPLTHIERISGENAVYIKNANLEAYPHEDKYRKMGPFRMGANGFNNRREYRALVLYNALISLQDQFEYQSRVDAYRKSKKSLWQPLFYISDIGQSLGMTTWGNTGTVNEYTWDFTWVRGGEIHLLWLSVFHPKTWENTTYSDVKWMARRMARIKSSQIDDILKTSGMPEPAQVLYAEKIKSRINNMIKDFDLDKEGFKGHVVKSKKELSSKYPKYIDDDGYLKEGVQQIQDNTIPILGNTYTPLQKVKSVIIDTFANKASEVITQSVLTDKFTQGGLAEFKLGQVKGDSGKIYEASRAVSVNSEVGPDQRRYLVKDRLSLGLPIGLDTTNLKTPVTLYYLFSYEYTHSVDTLAEIASKNFFKKLNPFELDDIRKNLKRGEQLKINHSYGASIGEVRLKGSEQLQVEAALVGVDSQTIKTMYFTKSDDLLEAHVTHFNKTAFKTGLDFRAAIRLALMYQKNKSHQSQSYYKIDLLNEDLNYVQKLNTAFTQALVENDFTALNFLIQPLTVDIASKGSGLSAGLILWNRDSSAHVSDIYLKQQNIILAQKTISHDRSFDRIWNDKNAKPTTSILNFVGNLTNEGESIDIAFEGTIDSNKRQFSKFEVNMSFSKADRFTSVKDFHKKFTHYFNQRSGEKEYINFAVPEQIDQYLDLFGLMRWQLNANAVVVLMSAITNKDNLEHLKHNTQRAQDKSFNKYADGREYIIRRALKVIDVLENPKQKQFTKEELVNAAKDAIAIIERFIGSKGQNVALVRKHVSENDLWIITSIEELLDLTNPTFRLRNDYWAPEIGKFQGHSDLNVFRRTRLMSPILAQ